MRIYCTVADNGDGSSSVVFFESQECINLLENAMPERYASGEGGTWFDCYEFSEKVQTLKEVEQEIKENEWDNYR